MILELCKGGVHCVDLGESFQTHIYLQNLASIQPRTSPLKFVGSRGQLSEVPGGNAHADGAPSASPVPALVERFDRRGTEPFELFRSEFGQNSVRIKEILLE